MNLKKGDFMNVRKGIRTLRRALMVERRCYAAASAASVEMGHAAAPHIQGHAAVPRRRVDVALLFGGKAAILERAPLWHLKPGENYDIVNGCDLRDPLNLHLMLESLRDKKPGLLVISPPCTVWSWWNTTVNYRLRGNSLYDNAVTSLSSRPLCGPPPW